MLRCFPRVFPIHWCTIMLICKHNICTISILKIAKSKTAPIDTSSPPYLSLFLPGKAQDGRLEKSKEPTATGSDELCKNKACKRRSSLTEKLLARWGETQTGLEKSVQRVQKLQRSVGFWIPLFIFHLRAISKAKSSSEVDSG